MRFFSCLLAVVLFAACGRPPTPSVELDEQLDAAEARDFCDKWMPLQGRDTPEAALMRASLALQVPRSVIEEAPCANWEQLTLQGRQDALRATEQLPNNPDSWFALAAWLERGDAPPDAVADAACKAAQLTERNPTAWLACGDWLRRANNAQAAIDAWKRSFELSATRGEQCALVQRIRMTSQQPQQALESLPQEVVQDCEMRRMQRQQLRQKKRWFQP